METTTTANEPQENTEANTTPALVETVEGTWVTPSEAAMMPWCEYFEQHTENETRNVYRGQAEAERWSRRAVRENLNEGQIFSYCGEYYDEDALNYYDLVQLESGGIRSRSDAYEHSDGTWHSTPEDPNAAWVREYHDDGQNTYRVKFTPGQPEHQIGFEIEKEDRTVKESIDIETFEHEYPKWRKEADGSLNRYTGYELISPAFELNPDEIRKYIESRPDLVRHVNANHSTRCGGHIHVSRKDTDGLELFDSIRGYVHLLHALYYGRTEKVHPETGNKYSEAKSIYRLRAEARRFQSVNVMHDRLELRIFSAVRNLDNLHWRARLVQYMMQNPTQAGHSNKEALEAVHADLVNENSTLHSLLAEVYPTLNQMQTLAKRFRAMVSKYEGIEIEQTTNPKTAENLCVSQS